MKQEKQIVLDRIQYVHSRTHELIGMALDTQYENDCVVALYPQDESDAQTLSAGQDLLVDKSYGYLEYYKTIEPVVVAQPQSAYNYLQVKYVRPEIRGYVDFAVDEDELKRIQRLADPGCIEVIPIAKGEAVRILHPDYDVHAIFVIGSIEEVVGPLAA